MSVQIHRLLLAAAALPSIATGASASAEPIYLSYYLPRAEIGAAVSQRLVRCPMDVNDGEIEVETTWSLRAVAKPDYAKPVVVDASSGFLAARTVGLKLNPDGTLASINAKSTGQGGPVLASVIKLAGTFAPMLAGIPPLAPLGAVELPGGEPTSLCHDQIVELLERHSVLAARIDQIEAAIADGGSGIEQEDLLALYRQQLSAIEDGLTLTGQAEGLNGQLAESETCAGQKDCSLQGEAVIGKLPYATWFRSVETAERLPGYSNGFVVGWAGSSLAAAGLAAMPGKGPRDNRQQELVYLRPVPAVLVGAPCPDDLQGASCTIDNSIEDPGASASLEFLLPQLSPRFSLPVGSAGIFGSREVAVAFDAWGRPVELTYGSDPGADAIAGTIDAVGSTATQIHTAQLDAMNHAIAVQEARDKLAAFQAGQ